MIVPEGKIATGKLAQALMHGARVSRCAATSTRRSRSCASSSSAHPIALVNSVNPFRLEGQKTAAFEIVDELGERRRALHPGRQRRQHHRLLAGLPGARRRAAHARLPGRGRGAARARRAGRATRDGRQRDPDRQPGPLGGGDGRDDRLARRDPRRHRRARSSTPTASSRASEGVFCEPASAASVAGLLAHGADGAERVVCVLTGHGLKDPQTALEQAGAVVPCEPDLAAVEAAVLRLMQRRRLVRVPASSANLGPGFDVLAAALALHLELEVEETGAFAVDTDLDDRARPRATSSCAPSSACTPPTASRSRSAREIPLSGGLGSSAAAIVAGAAGRRPPVRARRRPARAVATELEGHPDNVAAALLGGFVVCADGERRALRPAGRAGGDPRRARTSRCARREARAALPAEVPLADAVFNVAHARAARARPRARRLGPGRRAASHDRLHQPRRAHLYPRSMELVERARELGALGATISGAGPTVLVWSHYEQTGAVAQALRARPPAGPTSCACRSSRRAPTCARCSSPAPLRGSA